MKTPPILQKNAMVAHWRPDKEFFVCCNCQDLFTILNRKHHCRRCGKVFCSACTPLRISLPELGYSRLQRCCTRCGYSKIISLNLGESGDSNNSSATTSLSAKNHILSMLGGETEESSKVHIEDIAKLSGYVEQCKAVRRQQSIDEALEVQHCLVVPEFTVARELRRGNKTHLLVATFTCPKLSRRKFVIKKLWDAQKPNIKKGKGETSHLSKIDFYRAQKLQMSLLSSNDYIAKVYEVFYGPTVCRSRNERDSGSGKTAYAVLEYCTGSLRDLVNEAILSSQSASTKKLKWVTPFPPRRVLLIGLQIAQGLSHLHNHGISHNNLTLEHLLLSGSEAQGSCAGIRITDFLTMTLKGDDEDVLLKWGANDMWSLGCVLYELASLRSPYISITEDKKIKGNIPLSPEYTIVQRVIDKCHINNTQRRITADGAIELIQKYLWPTMPSAPLIAAAFAKTKRYSIAVCSPKSTFFRAIEEELFLEYLVKKYIESQTFLTLGLGPAIQNKTENSKTEYPNKFLDRDTSTKYESRHIKSVVPIQSMVRRIQSYQRVVNITHQIWSKLKDVDSGFFYWYNENTGESSWESPRFWCTNFREEESELVDSQIDSYYDESETFYPIDETFYENDINSEIQPELSDIDLQIMSNSIYQHSTDDVHKDDESYVNVTENDLNIWWETKDDIAWPISSTKSILYNSEKV